MRAWWQDADHWRVDQLLLTGETDLVHEGETTLRWDYEHLDATLSRDPDIRLPRTADLVPPVLAERLLRGVDRRRRDAGSRPGGWPASSAPGLRVVAGLRPVEHRPRRPVARPRTPAYRSGSRCTPTARHRRPSPASSGTSPSDRPADARRRLRARRPGVDVEFDDVLDIADAANQYAPVRPPDTVAGLPKAASSDRAVGVYGARDDPGDRHPAA